MFYTATNAGLGSHIWSQNCRSHRLVRGSMYICIETLSNLFRPAEAYPRIRARIRATARYGVLSSLCSSTIDVPVYQLCMQTNSTPILLRLSTRCSSQPRDDRLLIRELDDPTLRIAAAASCYARIIILLILQLRAERPSPVIYIAAGGRRCAGERAAARSRGSSRSMFPCSGK
jgi:hypothetical protein